MCGRWTCLCVAEISGRQLGVGIGEDGAGTRGAEVPQLPIGKGLAISILAAREGAALACADVDLDAATETARLVGVDGGRAAVIVGDVSDEHDCVRIVDEAVQALDGLDGLVCNVGIGLRLGLEGTTAQPWD